MSALRSRVKISTDWRPHFMVLRALPEARIWRLGLPPDSSGRRLAGKKFTLELSAC